MIGMKDIDKNFDWVKREVLVAHAMFDTVIHDMDPEDDDLKEFIPDLLSYMRDPWFYKNWWDTFKNQKLDEFKTTHKDSIDHLENEKNENFDKLSMNDDQKLEYFVKRELELTELRNQGIDIFQIPDAYYTDLKAIRAFFNSTLAVYFSLLSKIVDLFMEYEYFWFDISDPECPIEDRLHNDLHPFGNLVELNQHFDSCKGCPDCDSVKIKTSWD